MRRTSARTWTGSGLTLPPHARSSWCSAARSPPLAPGAGAHALWRGLTRQERVAGLAVAASGEVPDADLDQVVVTFRRGLAVSRERPAAWAARASRSALNVVEKRRLLVKQCPPKPNWCAQRRIRVSSTSGGRPRARQRRSDGARARGIAARPARARTRSGARAAGVLGGLGRVLGDVPGDPRRLPQDPAKSSARTSCCVPHPYGSASGPRRGRWPWAARRRSRRRAARVELGRRRDELVLVGRRGARARWKCTTPRRWNSATLT